MRVMRDWTIGSIPACAGEPERTAAGCKPGKVYPRVCGGTGLSGHHRDPSCGLSPRVRGNHLECVVVVAPPGSIPACAGEPGAARCRCIGTTVYPRVCGGTHLLRHLRHLLHGLSPRVRGNRTVPPFNHVFHRSIPACAGEPGILIPPGWMLRVYPRVCGGTVSCRLHLCQSRGLSPRVRGNHCPDPCREERPGSIPACAGEPGAGAKPGAPCRVYPRVCGGTGATEGQTGRP